MNGVILEIFPFIDFNCTSFTGLCIFIKNLPDALHKYLGTYYDYLFGGSFKPVAFRLLFGIYCPIHVKLSEESVDYVMA